MGHSGCSVRLMRIAGRCVPLLQPAGCFVRLQHLIQRPALDQFFDDNELVTFFPIGLDCCHMAVFVIAKIGKNLFVVDIERLLKI